MNRQQKPSPYNRNGMTRRERIVLHNRLMMLRRAIKTGDAAAILDARDAVLPEVYKGEYDTGNLWTVPRGLVPMLDRMDDRFPA